ncbi:peptidoglycan DD-metalloendopeptidase family protein [bacterium]|nr:peptidoglycan DD-metalloendopeptidase family protein [bacterium]
MKFWIPRLAWLMAGLVLLYLGLIRGGLLGQRKPELPSEEAPPPPEPVFEFGLRIDSLVVERQTIAKGASLGGLLQNAGVPSIQVQSALEMAGSLMDFRKLRAGQTVHLYRKPDTSQSLCFAVYPLDEVHYVVFDLSDSTRVYKGEKPVRTVRRAVGARIERSLYETLQSAGAPPDVIVNAANLFVWTVDFFKVREGDVFKLIFEDRYVDDTVQIKGGSILGASIVHQGKEFHAIRFEKEGNLVDYFDVDGRTLKRFFLKAPLDFFRISSKFNMNRYHPVLKRVKPHLGTDYAAPTGTPILSTAAGVVEKAGYTSGNGNYVKVKHDEVYSTQYLHMSRIAKGMRPGRRVAQGEVIGYVGSTGLATGPHVCYRFWKNGKQVDPLKENLPQASEVEKSDRALFELVKTRIKAELDSIPIDPIGEEAPQVVAGRP